MEKGSLITATLFIVCSYLYVDYLKYGERPIVEIENGKLRGIVKAASEYRGRYSAFMGIPYAAPPVHHLRFEPPSPPQNWSDVRDAGYYRSQCIGLDVLFTGLMYGNEDCLFLNVFVPIVGHNLPMPVMVFFHGGYWHIGSSQDHGEKRFMGEDVILVTLNYRLGALGFLSTGDGVVRGNQGLKDQNMALKWIQRNIKAFGGDPTRVTIFGESVGAASVHLHMLSPISRGLFHRGISQSGSAINEFVTTLRPKVQAKRYAKKFDCPTDNSKEMVKCLKKLDASVLVKAHSEAFDGLRSKAMMFGAVVEAVNDSKAFLVQDPLKMLERGDFLKIPWIVGVNSHEGRFTSAGVSSNKTREEVLKKWDIGLPTALKYSKNDKLSEKIQNYYFPTASSNTTQVDYVHNLTNLISDYAFYHPASKSAKLHSQHAETYLYYLNYGGYFSLNKFWVSREYSNYFGHPAISIFLYHAKDMVQEFILGRPVVSEFTCHGDELPLLFNFGWCPDFVSMLPDRDLVMSRKIIRLWTSFAKSWNKLTIDKVTWEPVNPKNGTLRYLEISTNPSMIDEPFTEGVKFWESTYYQLDRD